jgi:hypothetical protein
VVSCPTGSGVMKPRGVRQRAAEEMKMTARAARKLGVVVGFTGSAIWKYVAMFRRPPRSSWTPGTEADPRRLRLGRPRRRRTRRTRVRRAAGLRCSQIGFRRRLLDAVNAHAGLRRRARAPRSRGRRDVRAVVARARRHHRAGPRRHRRATARPHRSWLTNARLDTSPPTRSVLRRDVWRDVWPRRLARSPRPVPARPSARGWRCSGCCPTQ